MKAFFLYFLRDPENCKKGYVGISENAAKRYRQHLNTKERCYRGNWIRSLKRRGLKPELEVLAQVPESTSKSDEINYIAAFRTMGYALVNGTNGGEGTARGMNHYLFGKKLSPERCAQISAATTGVKNPMFGKKHSPELCEQMRRAHCGVPLSANHRVGISKGLRGKKSPLNTSGFSNVFWDTKNKKWRVSFRLSGTIRHFGRYKKLEDAVFVRALVSSNPGEL